MKVHIEHTDTFGGEANYCWVHREDLELPDTANDRAIVRACKKAIGMTGVKCNREDWQDIICLRPRGVCQVIFITFGDEG